MLYLIIAAGLLFALTIIAFKLIKNSIKVMALIITLLVLTVVTGSVLLYLDAKDLHEHITTSNTTILFVDDVTENVLAGFSVRISNTTDKVYFDSKKISEYEKQYKAKTLEEAVLGSYKVILISKTALNNTLPDRMIVSDDKVISKDFFFGILESEEPIDYYLDKIIGGMVVDDLSQEKSRELKKTLKNNLDINNDQVFKSKISGLVFDSIIMNYPENIIIQYKKGNIVILPETIMLRLIKMIPDDKLKEQFDSIRVKVKTKIQNQTKDKITEVIDELV
ncbi:hypothetical protein JXM83_04190 [Candidatus Woesearchaeota archaeon]|nr:hypothetical protein [Candidatus Woesearchaeota archaeon]